MTPVVKSDLKTVVKSDLKTDYDIFLRVYFRRDLWSGFVYRQSEPKVQGLNARLDRVGKIRIQKHLKV